MVKPLNSLESQLPELFQPSARKQHRMATKSAYFVTKEKGVGETTIVVTARCAEGMYVLGVHVQAGHLPVGN